MHKQIKKGLGPKDSVFLFFFTIQFLVLPSSRLRKSWHGSSQWGYLLSFLNGKTPSRDILVQPRGHKSKHSFLTSARGVVKPASFPRNVLLPHTRLCWTAQSSLKFQLVRHGELDLDPRLQLLFVPSYCCFLDTHTISALISYFFSFLFFSPVSLPMISNICI